MQHNTQRDLPKTRRFRRSAGPLALAVWFLILTAAVAAQVRIDEARTSTETMIATGDERANQYRIGAGDVLDIRVYNRPQLSRDAIRVDARGLIRMPLLEKDIQAGCRTDSELAAEIVRLYLEYLRNPHVEVFIKEFQSKPAAVIGAVREPGRFQMQRKVRLLELISLAGGPSEQAGGRIQIKHDPTIRPCREDDAPETPENGARDPLLAAVSDESVTWYEFDELLRGAASDINPFVRPGDVVNLVEADKVYVVGNVVKPSVIPLKDRVTLSQAIAIAGGTLPDTSFDKVRVVRRSADGAGKTELVFDLKAISKRKAEDIVLQSNDIVEVPSSSGKKFLRGLLNTIGPTISRLPVRVIP
jgi:polysaccharide biosynthesis/export protein